MIYVTFLYWSLPVHRPLSLIGNFCVRRERCVGVSSFDESFHVAFLRSKSEVI